MKYALILFLFGCDPSADSLIGSWRNPTVQQTFTFNTDHTLRIDNDAKGPNPGCDLHHTLNGSWSASGTTVKTTTTSGTVQVIMCFDPADNQPLADDPNAVLGMNSYTWAVNGSSLTLTSASGAVSYTRQ